MVIDNTLVFVDGENLSIRYKEMLVAGKVPRPDNIYIEDCFIWNQRVLNDNIWNIKRLSYYASVIGDDLLVRNVRERIAATTFTCVTDRYFGGGGSNRTGQIVPFVIKKSTKSKKESVCDIAIAVDVMRACYRDHAETTWVFSGDGDFIQLLEEGVHSGKCAYASAFSSGLNEDIRFVVDEFLPLDKHFFLTDQELEAAAAQKLVPAAIDPQPTVPSPETSERQTHAGT
jgi:uncharacterized LabA/DUF88 family protein